MNLEELGLSGWLRDRLRERGGDETRLARVVGVDRELYLIASPAGIGQAEVTGRLLYLAGTSEEMPCVGDWVLADHLDPHSTIHDILPRRTLLRRRAAGDRSAYQPIAANIDVAYIVQSCDADFNLNRLDRYVVMINDGGITPRLMLTKCDLVARTEVEHMIAVVRREHGIEVAAVSSVTGDGYRELSRSLQAGKTYCLLGSSGVGKSTMVNRLLGTEALAIGSLSGKSGKGRHTTSRRQLIALENGALFVDTPGMRELGMMAFGDGLEEGFQDIRAAAASCRYPGCTHTVEKGCAVLARVMAGELSDERYQSYLKLLKESEHYETGYLERKRRDKRFGKMQKSYRKLDKRN